MDALIAELLERQDDPHWFMSVTDADCRDLAVGVVPRTVEWRAKSLLEELDAYSRRLAGRSRPTPKSPKRARTGAPKKAR